MSNLDKIIELKKTIQRKKYRAVYNFKRVEKANMKKYILIHGVRADTYDDVLDEIEKLIK